MFWGLILKANKKYTQTVQKAFHLSQAALDLSKSGEEDVQVMLTSEDNTYLLCTLGKKNPQVALDLNFDEGDQISLSTKGEGFVHLTGYLVPSDDDMFGGEDDELEDEEDEEVEVPQNAQNSKAKKKERLAKKVAEKVNAKEVKEDDGEDDDDMDETFELPKGANKPDAESDDSEDDDEDDDDDDDDDEEEEMDNSQAKAGDSDDEEDDDDDDEDDDDDDSDESEDEQPKAKVAKLEKKPSKQNGLENGKVSSKELKKDEKGQQVQKEESKSRTLQGGLVVEDLRVGNGQEAKPGKKIAVYYEGRLKKNNKVFDSTNKGAGFKFMLGRGEVIKGWDVGVVGMKVGGKRRLTVPHQMAYGTRGSPPVIPPNSTLVFDVELKNVF